MEVGIVTKNNQKLLNWGVGADFIGCVICKEKKKVG